MASKKVGLVITGKVISKKNKGMYAFIGKPETKTAKGWKFHPKRIEEVFDKKNFNLMKRGDAVDE